MKGLGFLAVIVILAVMIWLAQAKLTKGTSASASADRPPLDPAPTPAPGNPLVSVGNDVLDSIAEKIAQVEGFYKKGSLAQRTNNPGMVGGDNAGGYADAGDGWDGLYGKLQATAVKHPEWDFYDLMHWWQTGDTMGQSQPGFISADQYAETVAAYAGADPTQSVYSALYGEG